MSNLKDGKNIGPTSLQLVLLWTVFTIICLEDHSVRGQIGLVCSKDSDCKMSASYVCGPRKTCACAKGFRFELAKFACGRHLVDQDEKCDPSWDVCKGGPNSECASKFLGQKAVCQCKAGYKFDVATELCQPPDFVTNNQNQNQNQNNNNNDGVMTTSSPSSGSGSSGVPPGGHCSTNTDCRGFPNATCYYFVNSDKRQCDCTFDTHYYDSKTKTCLPKKGMGSPCSSVEECVNLSNIQCMTVNAKQGFKTCTCKPDFYFNEQQQRCTQASEIGGSCAADEQCKARPHSFCDVSSNSKIQRRCACLPGKEFYEGAGSCVSTDKPIPFGQPCKTTSQCMGAPSVVCKNTFLGMIPVCSCPEGLNFNEGTQRCQEGSSSSNNDIDSNAPASSGSSHQQQQDMEVDLNFNVVMKMHCKQGKCKAAKTYIMNNES